VRSGVPMRSTRSRSRANARTAELAGSSSAQADVAVATGPFGALSHDELGVIFAGLADPVDPGVPVALSSTCKGLRTPLLAFLDRCSLRTMHSRVVELCLKVRLPWWELRDAPSLGWQFNPTLTAADLATLNMILRISGLPRLKTINLGYCGFIDVSIQVLFDGLGRGAAPSLETLSLCDNHFGPVGAAAVAGALSRGAMPQLKKLVLNGNLIMDQGLTALAAPLRKLPALKELCLTACEFGDEGVASLLADVDATHFKSLELLLMQQNQLTDATCDRLTAAINAGALPALRSPSAGGDAGPGLQFKQGADLHYFAVVALERALAQRWGLSQDLLLSMLQ